MSEIKNSNKYDLEERTYKFAGRVQDYIKALPKTISNFEYGKQLIRSSGSQGANYMEANAASSRKDFGNKIFICKKEAQETKHWLRMLATYLPEKKEEIQKQKQ